MPVDNNKGTLLRLLQYAVDGTLDCAEARPVNFNSLNFNVPKNFEIQMFMKALMAIASLLHGSRIFFNDKNILRIVFLAVKGSQELRPVIVRKFDESGKKSENSVRVILLWKKVRVFDDYTWKKIVKTINR